MVTAGRTSKPASPRATAQIFALGMRAKGIFRQEDGVCLSWGSHPDDGLGRPILQGADSFSHVPGQPIDLNIIIVRIRARLVQGRRAQCSGEPARRFVFPEEKIAAEIGEKFALPCARLDDWIHIDGVNDVDPLRQRWVYAQSRDEALALQFTPRPRVVGRRADGDKEVAVIQRGFDLRRQGRIATEIAPIKKGVRFAAEIILQLGQKDAVESRHPFILRPAGDGRLVIQSRVTQEKIMGHGTGISSGFILPKVVGPAAGKLARVRAGSGREH